MTKAQEKIWEEFWDKVCTSFWGETKNGYKPERYTKKIMNEYTIIKNNKPHGKNRDNRTRVRR